MSYTPGKKMYAEAMVSLLIKACRTRFLQCLLIQLEPIIWNSWK